MRKFFAVAMGSVAALVGFAGAANASATVDLIWIDISTTNTAGAVICLGAANRNCPSLGTTLSSVAVTDNITLGVIITAGPGGIGSAGVSVDYRDAVPKLSVDSFRTVTTTKPLNFLPVNLGTTNAAPDGWVQNFNSAGSGPNAGIGLPAGGTAYLGTVTFHKDALVNGTFELAVGDNGPFDPDTGTGGTDGIGNLAFENIAGVSEFNSAFLINVPEPGALSLLVMGLGGMLLAGRGRRS